MVGIPPAFPGVVGVEVDGGEVGITHPGSLAPAYPRVVTRRAAVCLATLAFLGGCDRTKFPDPPAPVLSVDGKAVRGSTVRIEIFGFDEYAEEEASVVAYADNGEQHGIGAATITARGGAVIDAFVPDVIAHEYPVGLGPLPFAVFARMEKLTDGEFEVVAAIAGRAYPATMVSECGPTRVDFDGAVWVPAADQDGGGVGPSGLGGTMTIIDAGRARFTAAADRTVELVPADQSGFAC